MFHHPPSVYHLVDVGICLVVGSVTGPLLARGLHLPGLPWAVACLLTCAAACYICMWLWRWVTGD